MLAAALSQNPMLWRTSPIGTELEAVVVDWLRQGLGLPPSFDGLLTDTASTSSLIALAAAREAAGLDAATRGLAHHGQVGEPGAPRVYASAEAHSSIEKACMTLGHRQDRIRPDRDERALRAATRSARSGDRGRPGGGPDPDCDRGDARDDRVDIGRSGGCHGRHRRTRRRLAPRRRGLRRGDRARSGLARTVRRLGAGGLGPRQPAQVAVHAVRRIAPADPPDGSAPGRLQCGPGVPANARPEHRGPRLQ